MKMNMTDQVTIDLRRLNVTPEMRERLLRQFGTAVDKITQLLPCLMSCFEFGYYEDGSKAACLVMFGKSEQLNALLDQMLETIRPGKGRIVEEFVVDPIAEGK